MHTALLFNTLPLLHWNYGGGQDKEGDYNSPGRLSLKTGKGTPCGLAKANQGLELRPVHQKDPFVICIHVVPEGHTMVHAEQNCGSKAWSLYSKLPERVTQ
jgi:hypothetical protein